MDNFKFPHYFKYLIPLAEVLRDMEGSGKSSEVIDLIVEKLGIHSEELLETYKSGQPIIHMHIYRAKHFLFRTGYLFSPKQGVWSLTERGLKFDFTSKNLIDLHKQNSGWRYNWFKPAAEIEGK